MRAFSLVAMLALGFVAACGADSPAGPAGSEIRLSLSHLRPLDPSREGAYALWARDRSGQLHLAGTFVPPAGGVVSLTMPVDGAVALEVTVEPPADPDPGPSGPRLLAGQLRGGRAELSLRGAVTQGDLPLREKPGQFTMFFTPSDNHLNAFPSHEEAGIWLFNVAPRDTEKENAWVYLTQLAEGWIYEGWVVRDHGTPGAIWLSYGKFLPDTDGALRSRDNTGWGPFSGVRDFKTAGEEEYPGDDWISNPLSYPWPAELRLPLDLREVDAAGAPRWTHVISIEPLREMEEPISSERPFPLQPYSDRFRASMPGFHRPYGLPHPITFRPDVLPGGSAEVRQ